TLTLCVGSYELALMLHFSAPIAVVVAGLVVGHKVKQLYSDHQLHHLHLFWEFIDELLNTSLFALMGITVVFIHFDLQLFLLGVLGYFVVLF
ncbi:cation:proton antiporter, partial [Limosilactobacillus fermentum]|uniref:cation:proton antiporter domain-containing protein n=1 Tax=Limosilactobacillus fermentum TaxID=1613 RepID=UPI0030E9FA76